LNWIDRIRSRNRQFGSSTLPSDSPVPLIPDVTRWGRFLVDLQAISQPRSPPTRHFWIADSSAWIAMGFVKKPSISAATQRSRSSGRALAVTAMIGAPLGGHPKTGHTWSLQNRHRNSGRTTVVITQPDPAEQDFPRGARRAQAFRSEVRKEGDSSPNRWECGNRASDFQARGEGRETVFWFSGLSMARHFHGFFPSL